MPLSIQDTDRAAAVLNTYGATVEGVSLDGDPAATYPIAFAGGVNNLDPAKLPLHKATQAGFEVIANLIKGNPAARVLFPTRTSALAFRDALVAKFNVPYSETGVPAGYVSALSVESTTTL